MDKITTEDLISNIIINADRNINKNTMLIDGEDAVAWVTAYVNGKCKASYEYHDQDLNEMRGGETHECSFDDLINYLDQLPKPFHFYTKYVD